MTNGQNSKYGQTGEGGQGQGGQVAGVVCSCLGWCDCHKPGWPKGERCDCVATVPTPTTKPAGSLTTKWEVRTYDVWGNAKDGWEVNNTFAAGEVELRIPQTRYNVGVQWHVCRNPECPGNNPCGHNPPCAWGAHRRESHGVIPTTTHNSETGDTRQRCPECWEDVTLESQEFVSASPSDRQIKRAFGVTCRIDVEGDDVDIQVNRSRDGYPIGEMRCVSHESLSPVRRMPETHPKYNGPGRCVVCGKYGEDCTGVKA